MKSWRPLILAGFLLVFLPPAVSGNQKSPIFTEVSLKSGLVFHHFNGMTGDLHMFETIGGGVALLDFDNDGDVDIYLLQGSLVDPNSETSDALIAPKMPLPLRDKLFRNELIETGRLGFTDVTEKSGIDARGYGMGVAVGDYDNDGFPDLYITNFGPNQLWHNNGDGTFTDVTAKAGVGDSRWNVSAAFVDFDSDGHLDLYVTAYLKYSLNSAKSCFNNKGIRDYCGPSSFPHPANRLYRNRGDGTFEDATVKAGIARTLGSSLGTIATDFNHDDLPDLYVANDRAPNELWINQGNGTFVNDALFAGCAVNLDGRAESSMGVTAGDSDGDGDSDLFVTHLGGETNTFYLNDGRGGFLDATIRSGLALPSQQFTSFGTEFFDWDRDGDLDLITVNGAMNRKPELVRAGDPFPMHEPNKLYRNTGKGVFEDATAAGGPAFAISELSLAAAVGDIDNDGDADVLVTNNNGPARILLNNGLDGNHWLGLRAVGGTPPRDMLGARIEIFQKGKATLHRRIHTDGSYCTARDPRVLIGLGSSKTAVTARVIWPGGSREEFRGLKIDRHTTLVRGTGRPVGLKLEETPKPPLDQLGPAAQQQVINQQAITNGLLENPVFSRPDLAETFGSLGLLYQTYQLRPAAQSCYRNAATLDSGDFRWPYLNGIIALDGGNAEAAAILFEQALMLEPENLAALTRLGQTWLQLVKLDKAQAILEQALAIDPAFAPAHSLLGQVFLTKGQPGEGVPHLERVLELQPQATKTCYPLAAALRATGDTDRAAEVITHHGEGSVIFPDPALEALHRLNLSPQYHIDRCTDALEIERPAEAAAACRTALSLDPENSTARINLGAAMVRLTLIREAIAEYREVLRSDPGNVTARFNLGTTLAAADHLDAAVFQLKKLVAAVPDHADGHFNLANTLRRLGLFEESLGQYDETLHIDPTRMDADLGAALCLAKLGRCEQAGARLDSARSIDPENPKIEGIQLNVAAACAGRSPIGSSIERPSEE